jgi:hypothetical protein
MLGEFEKAWEIAWLGVREATNRGLGFLYDQWLNWKNWFLKLVDESLGYFQKKWLEITGGSAAEIAAVDDRTSARAAARDRERDAMKGGFKIVSDEIRAAREKLILSIEGLKKEKEDRNAGQFPELFIGGAENTLNGLQTGAISGFVAASLNRALGGSVGESTDKKALKELEKHTEILEKIEAKEGLAFTPGT